MRVDRILGGWYCDARPTGVYVVHRGDHLWTHVGRVDWTGGGPVGGLLFPRISPQGLSLAGQGHAGGAWAWNSQDTAMNGWVEIDPVCIGTSPVIWTESGWLVSHGGSVGVQGYRYLDPVTRDPVTGDDTYGPRVLPDGTSVLLYEWTDVGGGIYIGQGPRDGIWLRGADLRYRKIVGGAARFIRANRDGDNVAIAAWIMNEPAFLCWATVAELLALPSQDAPDPEPPPPPPPAPTVIDLDAPGLPVSLPPVWIGADGRPTLELGNCVVGWCDDPAENAPVLYHAGWEAEAPPHAKTKRLLCSLIGTEGNKPGDAVDADIALAQARGAYAVYLHVDSADHVVAVAWADRVRAAGLLPLVARNVVDQPFHALPPPDALTLNVRTGMRNHPNMVHAAERVRDWLESGVVQVVWVFGWYEAGVPLDVRWPKLAAYYRALFALAPPPARFPGTPAPLPPSPHPQPSPHHRPRRQWAALVGLAPLVAWLVQALRRRR